MYWANKTLALSDTSSRWLVKKVKLVPSNTICDHNTIFPNSCSRCLLIGTIQYVCVVNVMTKVLFNGKFKY